MSLDLVIEMIRVAWTDARAHLLRSMVTTLAVAAAVFSVVFLASLARSGTDSLRRGIEDVGGARLVAVFAKHAGRQSEGREGYPLTLGDADAVRARVPHVRQVAVVAPLGKQSVRQGDSRPVRADILGGNADVLAAFSMPLRAGRNLSIDDLRERRAVAILGHDVCLRLFVSCEGAVGSTIRLDRGVFRVVGVTDEIRRFGANLGFDWNGFAMVPATTIEIPPKALLILTDGAMHHDAVKLGTRRVLAARHQFADDVDLFDFGKVIEGFFGVFRTMEWLVALLAGIALVVAAFGIVNAQLASLRQRILDCGVRLALGAPPAALGVQMIFESGMMAILGACIGSGVGLGTAKLVGSLIERSQPGWVTVTAHDAVGGAFIAALVIGCLAGLLPARKAMRLEIVACLRIQ